jgi:predicted Holliday junction resolvase-like endonuclease
LEKGPASAVVLGALAIAAFVMVIVLAIDIRRLNDRFASTQTDLTEAREQITRLQTQLNEAKASAVRFQTPMHEPKVGLGNQDDDD